MDLTEHKPGNHYQVRGVDARGILVNDVRYSTSIIVGAQYLDADWPVTDIAEVTGEHLAAAVELAPELIVVGCGDTQPMLPPATARDLMSHGIGVETMTLNAACRTFNVLMSENRRALAALIWPESP